MHEHYDAEGKLTGTTVITRESEWDDETRDRVLLLAGYEDTLCRCGCGLPIDVAHAERPFIVDKVICQAGRALEQTRRQDREDAEKAKKPDGWSDGLHYYVQPYEPKEDRRG